jgi:hypothetical protein
MHIAPCKKLQNLKNKIPCFLSLSVFLSWPGLRLGPLHSLVIEWKLKSLPKYGHSIMRWVGAEHTKLSAPFSTKLMDMARRVP